MGIAHRGGTLRQINSRFARTDRAEIYAKLGDPHRVSSRLATPVPNPLTPPSIHDHRPVADVPIGFVTDTFIDPRVIQLEFNGYLLRDCM